MDSGQNCQSCSAFVTTDSCKCENCHKATYCSVEHQKADWQRHKEDCYPANIERNEEFGRFMVATRDIKQGEIIFHEKEALMIGPGGNFSATLMPLCLSCYRQVKTSYVCTVCKWPVCDFQCEQLSQHSEYECRILAKNNIPPVKQPIEYICINVLRCLLLKKADPYKWEKVIAMEDHSQARLRSSNSMSVFGLVWNFIETRCNLTEFDAAVIRKVLGAIEVNIHHFTDLEEDTGVAREGNFLFHKLSMLSHNCIPNTIWKRHRENDPPSTFSVTLYASMNIKKGEQIYNRYANIIKDTVSRRKYLKEGYYFDCNCKRCSSPTELGTFYSAIKCPIKSCSGYLLPGGYLVPFGSDCNSMDPFWKCQQCSLIKDYTFTCKMESWLARDFKNLPIEGTQESLNSLEEFVQHHSEHSVHPNYYFLVQIKHTMATILDGLIRKSKDENSCTSKEHRDFCTKQLRLCEDLFTVMNVLCPGYSIERGRLLYYVHQAKLHILLQSQNSQAEQSLPSDTNATDILYDELVTCGKEALEILHVAPDDSESQKMGMIVSENMKLLAREFGRNVKCLENVNDAKNILDTRCN